MRILSVLLFVLPTLVRCQFGSQAGPVPPTINYCPPFMAQETACTCFSNIDGAVIECKGPGGPAVIEKLKGTQTEIGTLVMSAAKIIKIGPLAFRNLRIKRLNLDHNKITTIHPDAFRGLENTLQSLSMAHNRFTEVPTDSLIGMQQLQVLNLRCNQIGNMFTPALKNVSALIELNLGCNQICKIAPSAFADVRGSLQSMILDNNCLDALQADVFRSFDKLLALHMQYNQFDKIESIELEKLPSLIMLRLTGNKLQSLDKWHVVDVPQMKYLNIDSNQLRAILPDSFTRFPNLEILDLSYNNIAEVPTGAFRGLEKLMQINLEGNAIQDIAPGAFVNSPVLLLLLGSNCISSINPQMFQGVPQLRQLSLTNNNIRLVQPLSFNHLVNMHMLDLSANKIQVIQPGALTASDHVTVLLQENPLVCTQDGYHIVQGGRPIHLINEPNEICLTNYASGLTDSCPTRKFLPPPPACCSAQGVQDILSAASGADNKTSPDTGSDNELNKDPLAQQFFAPKVPASTKVDTPNDNVVNVPATTPSTDSADGSSPRRPSDLSRFWRLTRPPTVNTDARTPPSTDVSGPTPAPVVDIGTRSNMTTRAQLTTVPVIPAVTPGPDSDPMAGQGSPFMHNSGRVFGSDFASQLPPWLANQQQSPTGDKAKGSDDDSLVNFNHDESFFHIAKATD